MSLSEKMSNFLLENIQNLFHLGCSGQNLEFPDFQLYAHDFLSYAEKELCERSEHSLINCVSNLKRAAECEMDTFIYACGLDAIKKKNLGFDAKLEFLKDIGIFSSRTLSRFNTIRNKLEHEYEVPDIEDIDVYYDLVSALVAVIQGTKYILSFGSNLELGILGDGDKDEFVGGLDIGYDYSKLCINATIEINGVIEELSADFRTNRKAFMYFFKVLILLNQIDCLSINYLKQKLQLKP